MAGSEGPQGQPAGMSPADKVYPSLQPAGASGFPAPPAGVWTNCTVPKPSPSPLSFPSPRG